MKSIFFEGTLYSSSIIFLHNVIRNKNKVLQLTYAGKTLKRVWMNTSEDVLGRKKQLLIHLLSIVSKIIQKRSKKKKPEQSTRKMTKRNNPRRVHKRKTDVKRSVRKEKGK